MDSEKSQKVAKVTNGRTNRKTDEQTQIYRTLPQEGMGARVKNGRHFKRKAKGTVKSKGTVEQKPKLTSRNA